MVENKVNEISEKRSNRRTFIGTLWIGLGLIAFAEIIWLIVSFLRPRKPKATLGDYGNVIQAGPVDGFAFGTVTAFPRGRFYLCRLDDGGFLAVSRQCTHLGCTVPWIEKTHRFECPCHASTFNIDGTVVEAPASRALDIYRVSIENKVVMVDTGARIKRTGFHKSQVVYPQEISS